MTGIPTGHDYRFGDYVSIRHNVSLNLSGWPRAIDGRPSVGQVVDLEYGEDKPVIVHVAFARGSSICVVSAPARYLRIVDPGLVPAEEILSFERLIQLRYERSKLWPPTDDKPAVVEQQPSPQNDMPKLIAALIGLTEAIERNTASTQALLQVMIVATTEDDERQAPHDEEEPPAFTVAPR